MIFYPILSIFGIVMPISVIGFMFARFILGVGEAGNFPAAIKTTAEWFPKKERSLSTGIFNSGANIGALVAPLSVPLISQYFGWEYTFVIVGAVGFLWLIFWQYYYDSPEKLLSKGKINKEEYNYINSDDVKKENCENRIKEFGGFFSFGYRLFSNRTMV
jgi:ACS family hexuronate transporter-like MFS transporter